ncbi:hypothetical protein DFH09DRAFT_1416524 [Mycena vulgaris]|nr:hypothetical protein DFH09DRAFT_1416524 [Mycena vulgaris]
MVEILHPGFFRFFPGIITYDDSKQKKRAVRRGDGKQAATILEWAGMKRDRHEHMSIGVCCSWTTTWVGKDLKEGAGAKNRAWDIVTIHAPGRTKGKQIAIWDCNTPEWDPTDVPVRERDVLSSRAQAILKTIRDKASGRSRDRVWHSFAPERAVDEGESIKATFQYLLDLVLRGPSILKMSGTDGVEGVEGFGEIRH